MKRRHQRDIEKYLAAYRVLHGTSVHPNAAAILKTRIVDDALTGRISYQAAESLIAQHHLESE